jgi:hypothetical protein
MKTLKILSTLVIALCMTAGVAIAADGSVGATSTGTTDLNITVPEFVEVTDILDPLVDVTYGGSGAVTANDDVCVWTNDSATSYKVTATGDGAGSAFTITDGSDTIAYTVSWNDVTGTVGAASLTATTQSGVQTGASNTYPCPANNANISVSFAENDVLSVQAGAYSGTLTLVLAPDDT